MKKYVPKMYKKTIFDINYDKLQKDGIKCLIFDLDNTLAAIDEEIPNKKVKDLMEKLKKKFNVWILSNNSDKKRIDKVANALKIDYISFAIKPFSFGFRRIVKKTSFKKKELCIIGDQIMTDVLGGNSFGIFTVLVEQIGVKDLKITSFNRYLEDKKVAKMTKLGLFKKGEFYE